MVTLKDVMHQKRFWGTFLEVQWLRLHAPNVGGMGLIPGQGTKILHAMWQHQKKGKKEKILKTGK